MNIITKNIFYEVFVIIFVIISVIILLCLLGLFSTNTALAVEKNSTAEDNIIKKELFVFIKSVVEDDTWLKAKSKEELKNSLKKYYNGILLEKIITNTWDFIKEPTDWYGKPLLKKIHITYIDSKKAQVTAFLSEQNVNTCKSVHGKAYYKLSKNQNWKITFAEYYWQQEE